ncbi:L-idonate 5-dehydrogenase [Limnohabitans sp. B9-3]|uniref:L-idonate 5-dehydrogenase n=1 Tax=Limnohabitans sp. B9-3 TaxID=1100707 RepID=UPI000C1E5043|nr:L-idonate 5-dehydrogenase [Limnohabitans sp. B9-3]PIT71644.1 L-idonate 5-dehydrogenase [Limnohabitans sp. B9-3]
MKAIVCHAPDDLRLDAFETDTLGPQQLAVRVAYGGICGSDLHYFRHGGFGTVRIKEPMVLGHEVSGIVSAVGSDVTNFAPGQRIAISPSRPCGVCQYCQKGHHNHCLDMRFYGSAMRFPHIQGAFRESLVIDASQAHKINDTLSLSLAALAEPLSVGLHAIQRAGSVFGKQVLVTGCGPIGALLIAGLRRAGAARIVAVDVADKPLECARAMGADDTINLATTPDGLAPFAANKGVFDVMFEASGNDKALRSGLDVVTPRGIIVSIGLGGDSTLPLNQLVGKELELRGTFRFHEEFAVAVRFLNEGLIDGRPVISHVLDFDHATQAFELACDKSQAMKVQINFGADKVTA